MIGVKFWLGCLLVLSCGVAGAHQQGNSYSRWQLPVAEPEQAPGVVLNISELDLSRIQLDRRQGKQYLKRVVRYVQQDLQLYKDGQRCQPGQAQPQVTEPGWLALTWPWQCPAANGEVNAQDRGWRIHSRLLLTQAPGHLHFARVMDGSTAGGPVRLLTARQNEWRLQQGSQTARQSGWWAYWQQGVIHILEGWDHLAFVLGLLLLASRFGQLAWLITGFTLGHSVTLIAASLGWLQPNIALIEAVIAWSIALVAAEVLAQRRGHLLLWWLLPLGLLGLAAWQGWAWTLVAGLAGFALAYALALWAKPAWAPVTRGAVTASFGLIHGCGFAAVLAQLNSQLSGQLSGQLGGNPQDMSSRWLELFGFNLGVEAGQLLVVVCLWPVLGWLSRRWRALPLVLAMGLLGLASYWWWLRVV